jgi:murein DD-endopeptidase MepM/ murein hydrolase activator NlpD
MALLSCINEKEIFAPKKWASSIVLLSLCAWLSPANSMELSVPIACDLGQSCFVQSHVDVDPGPGLRDWRCGTATYDGHTGLDIRVLSAAATPVRVLAAAPGTVRNTRDRMTESLLTGARREAITSRGCGNAVVIDHGGGWETIYCHMRPGSVRVRNGQKVERGEALGEVGYSGLAEFAHLHFDVRHQGKVVDPYLGTATDGTCRREAEASGGLWDRKARDALAYRQGQLIQSGFAPGPVEHAGLERDHRTPDVSREAAALVFFSRAINMAAGDRIRLSLKGPGDIAVQSTTEAVDRPKASYTAFAGRRRPPDGWPAGRYTGTAELLRGEAVVDRIAADITLP